MLPSAVKAFNIRLEADIYLSTLCEETPLASGPIILHCQLSLGYHWDSVA